MAAGWLGFPSRVSLNENYSQRLGKKNLKSNLNNFWCTLVFSIWNANLCIIVFGQLYEIAAVDALNPHRRLKACLSALALKIAFLKPCWELHLLIHLFPESKTRHDIWSRRGAVFTSIWLLAHILPYSYPHQSTSRSTQCSCSRVLLCPVQDSCSPCMVLPWLQPSPLMVPLCVQFLLRMEILGGCSSYFSVNCKCCFFQLFISPHLLL